MHYEFPVNYRVVMTAYFQGRNIALFLSDAVGIVFLTFDLKVAFEKLYPVEITSGMLFIYNEMIMSYVLIMAFERSNLTRENHTMKCS